MLYLEVKELKTWKEKTFGLINKEKAEAVFFKTRFGIHTFGLKFPIDVIILDNDQKVVKISEKLRPNRIFFWLPVFDKVLELPGGEIKKENIKIGDILKIKIT